MNKSRLWLNKILNLGMIFSLMGFYANTLIASHLVVPEQRSFLGQPLTAYLADARDNKAALVPEHSPSSEQSAQKELHFKNLSRTILLLNEHYVNPSLIDPNMLLLGILGALENRIPKLVVELPPFLKELEAKSNQLKKDPSSSKSSSTDAPPAPPTPAPTTPHKESLTVDLGGVKKTFSFEPLRSLWGMNFFVRDLFTFLKPEAEKQGLMKKSAADKDGISWLDLEYAMVRAMLGKLDPHSDFYEPKFVGDLELTTKGEFGGIGIVISIRDGFLTVISPIDGTPAAQVGMKAKDRITKIGKVSAINMDLNEAVNLLRGAPNSLVEIEVQRPGASKPLVFTMKRAIIKVESVAYALLDNNVGYIRIKTFNGKSASDVQNALIALRKQSKGKIDEGGVILDFRDNPGGLLKEALGICDLFLDGGEIVSTQGSTKETREVEMASKGQFDPKLKIITLGNGGSASASEIVIGALKYNNRAPFIGETTFGKGSVQLLFDFPGDPAPAGSEKPIEPAALKLTIAQYFAPGGLPIQTKGVGPDIALFEISAEKQNELNIFPNATMREQDLESHLLADKERADEKPLLELGYLAPPVDEVAMYGKVDAKKLNQDFMVQVAKSLLTSTKETGREAILANASEVSKSFASQQETKVIEQLKKFKIDWSKGAKTPDDVQIETSIITNNNATAGDKLKISLKVKNNSSVPLHRIRGITHAKTGIFDHREFLFGKIAPHSEKTQQIEFDIPKEVVSRKDFFTVEFQSQEGTKLSELHIPVSITGLPRPELSHLAFIEAPRLKAHEKIKAGEDIDVVVFVKNIGEGKSFEPTILLRNESGNKVFLKTGREQLPALSPHQEASARFKFNVTENWKPGDDVSFEVQIFDAQMQDVWRNQIKWKLDQEVSYDKIKSKKMILTEDAHLFDNADDKSRTLAHLKKGSLIEVLGESSGYYHAKVLHNLNGFIDQSKLADMKGNNKAIDFSKNKSLVAINYDRIPPKVKLQFAQGDGFSISNQGILSAQIDSGNVSDVLLYVNGKKVLYKNIEQKTPSKIEQMITLEPGVNTITLSANIDRRFGTMRYITVFYDDQSHGGPLFKIKETKETPGVSKK